MMDRMSPTLVSAGRLRDWNLVIGRLEGRSGMAWLALRALSPCEEQPGRGEGTKRRAVRRPLKDQARDEMA